MSAPQHCIGHISTPYGDAAILVGRYPSGGAIAIQLVDEEDPSEPMSTFSTNLVPYGASVAEDEFCVKTWSENEVLVAPMLATGLSRLLQVLFLQMGNLLLSVFQTHRSLL